MPVDPSQFASLGGWLADGGHAPIAATMPRFEQAAAPLMGSHQSTSPVLLYKAWAEVLGKYPDYVAQEIGDCVSFSNAHANDLIQCLEISLGEASEYQETSTEFIYATSREVAGILGRGDGSYGSAAAKSMTTIGIVSREMLGADGKYSGQRAKEWGRVGAPKSAKDIASKYKLGGAALVKTWAEMEAALNNGYPVNICSNQGFTMTRDAKGFCAARGTWYHSMFICGVRYDIDGALICQSWGPNVPSGPLVYDQPNFSFWADRRTVEYILGQGDSYALSGSPDFKVRKLPDRWTWGMAA